MKYKVGDKVRIKSLDWYNANKDKEGIVYSNVPAMLFTKSMSEYCGKIFTIIEIIDEGKYKLDLPNQYFIWQDYMFEDRLYDHAYEATESIEHNEKIIEYLESLGGINSYNWSGHSGPNFCYFINSKGFIEIGALHVVKHRGYTITEFKEQNTMKEKIIKISLETAKRWFKKGGELKEVALQAYKKEELIELPKTWEDCYKQLGYGEFIDNCCNVQTSLLKYPKSNTLNALPVGLGKPILALHKLLVCREVYRQGWKPNWMDENKKYLIICFDNYISNDSYCKHESRILSFQSKEIRDKFLENFRDLIEEAKELI